MTLAPVMEAGLADLGMFAALPEHGAPDGVGAVMLLGMGPNGWARFEASPEYADGEPEPLDRWSVRVIDALAQDLGAQALYPFGGPPYQPFLRWAAATGRIWPSPLGMSIHAEHGLWMSFRGALGFASMPDHASMPAVQRPCDTCADKPCLSACPVGAFSGEAYGVDACVSHITSDRGRDCRERGCLARRACPVGVEWIPQPERAAFHMGAFIRARQAL